MVACLVLFGQSVLGPSEFICSHLLLEVSHICLSLYQFGGDPTGFVFTSFQLSFLLVHTPRGLWAPPSWLYS